MHGRTNWQKKGTSYQQVYNTFVHIKIIVELDLRWEEKGIEWKSIGEHIINYRLGTYEYIAMKKSIPKYNDENTTPQLVNGIRIIISLNFFSNGSKIRNKSQIK